MTLIRKYFYNRSKRIKIAAIIYLCLCLIVGSMHWLVISNLKLKTTIAAPSFVGKPTFRWDNLDFNKRVNCGSNKCLFQSSSRDTTTTLQRPNREEMNNCGGGKTSESEQHQTMTGYLVTRDSKDIVRMFDGWKISQYLEARFGIKHFLLEPPIQMKLDNSLYKSFKKTVYSDDNISVQKISIMSKTSRELKSHSDIVKILEELLNSRNAAQGRPVMPVAIFDKINTISNISHQEFMVIADAEQCSFFKQLDKEVARTIDLLQCEPLMALDFQFILDTSGNLYHLDFDRTISQMGGLKWYNQTSFDAKVNQKLESALGLLSKVQRWTESKRRKLFLYRQQQYHGLNTTTAAPEVVFPPSTTIKGEMTCKGDWQAEETKILASNRLPCLATERVAIGRHTTTSTMPIASSASNTTTVAYIKDPGTGNARIRHPLLVALLRRVIEAGFYGKEAASSEGAAWDCNAYGDRVMVVTGNERP